MNADKWNVIEDFACRLSPDDPEAGRVQIGGMTASLELWLQPKLLLRQKTMLSIGIGPFLNRWLAPFYTGVDTKDF